MYLAGFFEIGFGPAYISCRRVGRYSFPQEITCGVLTIELLQHGHRRAGRSNGNSIIEFVRTLYYNCCLNLTLVDLQLSLSAGGAAESEGFEPPVRYRTTVFKTVTINRSDNSPYVLLLRKLQQV